VLLVRRRLEAYARPMRGLCKANAGPLQVLCEADASPCCRCISGSRPMRGLCEAYAKPMQGLCRAVASLVRGRRESGRPATAATSSQSQSGRLTPARPRDRGQLEDPHPRASFMVRARTPAPPSGPLSGWIIGGWRGSSGPGGSCYKHAALSPPAPIPRLREGISTARCKTDPGRQRAPDGRGGRGPFVLPPLKIHYD
jgi:hypothetical protein